MAGQGAPHLLLFASIGWHHTPAHNVVKWNVTNALHKGIAGLLPSLQMPHLSVDVQQWIKWIEHAQTPILLSTRDGRLLKPVPTEQRLSAERLSSCLEAALKLREPFRAEACKMLCDAWVSGKP